MTDDNIVGLEMELLCLLAEKYEPDVSALQEEYEQWHNRELTYHTVYQTLERLYDHGYVEKKPIDGRSYCYMLTTEGAGLLQSHREFVVEHTEEVEEALN